VPFAIECEVEYAFAAVSIAQAAVVAVGLHVACHSDGRANGHVAPMSCFPVVANCGLEPAPCLLEWAGRSRVSNSRRGARSMPRRATR
jgi:hypothetical protein